MIVDFLNISFKLYGMTDCFTIYYGLAYCIGSFVGHFDSWLCFTHELLFVFSIIHAEGYSGALSLAITILPMFGMLLTKR